jgi:hypothetical protein
MLFFINTGQPIQPMTQVIPLTDDPYPELI